MTFHDFYTVRSNKKTIHSNRVETDSHGSYKVVYADGDVYEYTMTLKPGAVPLYNSFKRNAPYYSGDQYNHVSRWNGEIISPFGN